MEYSRDGNHNPLQYKIKLMGFVLTFMGLRFGPLYLMMVDHIFLSPVK